MIERFGTSEHMIHFGNIAHIPITYISIEISPIPESSSHIRHCRGIPITDVAIGGGGICLIREPQVYRSLKIGIIKRGTPDIARPIGCPIRVTLKRVMDRRFVRVGDANLVRLPFIVSADGGSLLKVQSSNFKVHTTCTCMHACTAHETTDVTLHVTLRTCTK